MPRRQFIQKFTTAVLVGLMPISSMAQSISEGEPSRAADDRKAQSSDDLVNRLTRKAVNETEEDLMDAVMRMMDDVVHRVQTDFDPGEQTLTVQREISTKLDEAIKAAAARRRVRSVSPTSTKNADKRKLPSASGKVESKRTAQAGKPSDEGVADAPPGAAEVQAPRPGGELRDARRGWGNLPQRDREEVIQGIEEQFIERYRLWVERYYRSLQESDR